jgi:spermidine/putrescine transport system ATP-binding protein
VAGQSRVQGPDLHGGDRTGAVHLSNVTKRYGAVTAVDRLNLDVAPAEFLSLLGPSGCGKTTTLRMLAGFEQPDDGVISISGREVQGIPPYKRDVNTVFQHYALFPHMTVAENVGYGLRQKGVDRSEVSRRVGEALEMVKMTRLAKRKPRQMSGGQQQRVALARALVNKPGVLLLDEPLGALDRKLRQEMQIELKLLQREVGITFIFVTHDQEEALSMSDRIAVMLDGHIEQLADPDTIYDEPVSAFVAGFIGQQNFFNGTVQPDGSSVTCELGLQAVAGRVTGGVQRGGAALVAVRPEAVHVLDSDPGTSTNVLAGTLAGVSHLGDTVQFVVMVEGREIISRRPRHGAVKLEPGQPVWCNWEQHLTHVFPADQAALVLVDPAGEADATP